MPDNHFSEVTSQSWFGRIGGAIKGVLVGLIIFIIAFPVLFWNEGRAVQTYKTLKEGGGAVVSVAADQVQPGNEGQLVHLSGPANTDEILADAEFGISANAIKLKRNVEMFQWKENKSSQTKKKLGGGTETVTDYSYTQEWSESLIQSSGFKKPEGHQNPGSMTYSSRVNAAKTVMIGAFQLSQSLINKINNYSALPIENNAPIPDALQGKGQLHDGDFFIGDNPGSPSVGDLRIQFMAALPTEVSLIASQVGNTFEPYHAKAGGTIELLQTGIFSAEAMIQQAQQQNKVLTWIIRLVGFLMMAAGLALILKPLSVLADVLPILGDIVEIGTGLISLSIAAVLALITIAIAWIVYRPLLGVTLLAVAVALVYIIKRQLGKPKAAA